MLMCNVCVALHFLEKVISQKNVLSTCTLHVHVCGTHVHVVQCTFLHGNFTAGFRISLV